MQLITLVDASIAVGATRSRKKKIAILAEVLAALTPEEVPLGVAWLSGKKVQGKIGVGYAAIQGELSARQDRDGDPEPTWSLIEVNAVFDEIKAVSGKGSKARRAALIGALLDRATSDERAFLVRVMIGEVRQGALEGIMLDAVAQAAGLPQSDVRRAHMLCGDLGAVAVAGLLGGAEALGKFKIELFTPLSPMLAQTAQTVAEAVERLGLAIFETKLDGVRVQVHKRGDEVRVYTRRLHDATRSVPEIVEAVRALPADSLILDGEVLGLTEDGAPVPFQETMSRFATRRDVKAARRRLTLRPVWFDLLYQNGRELIDAPLSERSEILRNIVPDAQRVPFRHTKNVEEAEAFYAEVLDAGQEGLMAKDPAAPYAAGKRGRAWLKVKPVHTLDLVVLAADWGSGRRRGWLSNLHLGCRGGEDGEFVMLGKTFKGMTDAVLTWQTEALKERAVEEGQWTVRVRPELVVEIAIGDIQRSTQYPGGLALRFARLRGYRHDRDVSTAASIDDLQALYDQLHP